MACQPRNLSCHYFLFPYDLEEVFQSFPRDIDRGVDVDLPDSQHAYPQCGWQTETTLTPYYCIHSVLWGTPWPLQNGGFLWIATFLEKYILIHAPGSLVQYVELHCLSLFNGRGSPLEWWGYSNTKSSKFLRIVRSQIRESGALMKKKKDWGGDCWPHPSPP